MRWYGTKGQCAAFREDKNDGTVPLLVIQGGRGFKLQFTVLRLKKSGSTIDELREQLSRSHDIWWCLFHDHDAARYAPRSKDGPSVLSYP